MQRLLAAAQPEPYASEQVATYIKRVNLLYVQLNTMLWTTVFCFLGTLGCDKARTSGYQQNQNCSFLSSFG